MKPSKNMQAVLDLCKHQEIDLILKPRINIEKDHIDFESIPYGALPGGFQTVISWAYVLFCDEVKGLSEFGFRDPFSSFSNLDLEFQISILRAFGDRHNLFAKN